MIETDTLCGELPASGKTEFVEFGNLLLARYFFETIGIDLP